MTHIMSGQVVNESGQKPEGRRKGRRAAAQKVRGLTQIGGWYYYRGQQVEGKRPARVALKTRSFEEAVTKALALKRNVQLTERPGTVSYEGERYLLERERLFKHGEISEWTYDSDVSVMKLFQDWIGAGAMVGLIDARKVETWKAHLLKEGKRTRRKVDGVWVLSPGKPMTKNSVRTYLARLSSFLEWLKDKGALANNVMRDVEFPAMEATKVDRFCTKPERDKLIRMAAKREDLQMILMLGFHAGMRLNEMVQARPGWLRFWKDPKGAWHGEIAVQKTSTYVPKDLEARAIPLNKPLLRFFRRKRHRGLLGFLRPRKWEGEYIIRPDVERGKDKYRWNPRRPFGKLVEKAGLNWVTIHTMRHTYATHLVMGGVPIATVARWMGDGIVVTQKTYAGYLPQRSFIDAGL
jgi:integrase